MASIITARGHVPTLLFLLIGTLLVVAPYAHGASPTLSIEYPNGGQELVADGSKKEISWETSTKSKYQFHYFLIPQDDTAVLPPPPPGGSSVAFIEEFGGYSLGGLAPSIGASSYEGNIFLDLDLPAGDYTLRIYASKAISITKPSEADFFGESDQPFTVKSTRSNSASIELIAPEDGDTWEFGTPQILRWKSKNVSGMQLAFQNLSKGQPCTVATNINPRATVWLIFPILGAPCIGSSSQRLLEGEYKAALYDGNWQQTRVSAYSKEAFTLKKASTSGISETERLTKLIETLTEVLLALRAAR